MGVTTLEGAATLADDGHYVFKNADDTYTPATAENVTDYPDLTRVYKLTLPNYTEALAGENILLTAGNDLYVTGGEVKFKVTGNVSGDVKFGEDTLEAAAGVYTALVTGDGEIQAATFPTIDGPEFKDGAYLCDLGKLRRGDCGLDVQTYGGRCAHEYHS